MSEAHTFETTLSWPADPAQPLPPEANFSRNNVLAAAGKTAFDADCAVCHGNTLRNGTMGPPLASDAFTAVWAGRSVRELFDSAKTMPPADPCSLSYEADASMVAYVLQVNGYAAGETPLTTGDGTTLR